MYKIAILGCENSHADGFLKAIRDENLEDIQVMGVYSSFPGEAEDIFELGFANAWQRTHDTATHYPRPSECEGCRYQGVCKHCVAEHASGAPCGHASPMICAWGQRMVAEGIFKLP